MDPARSQYRWCLQRIAKCQQKRYSVDNAYKKQQAAVRSRACIVKRGSCGRVAAAWMHALTLCGASSPDAVVAVQAGQQQQRCTRSPRPPAPACTRPGPSPGVRAQTAAARKLTQAHTHQKVSSCLAPQAAVQKDPGILQKQCNNKLA